MKLTSLALAAGALLAGCAPLAVEAPRAAPQREATTLERAFPAPRATIEVPASGVTLEQLLARLTEASGVNFVFDAKSRDVLAAASLNLTQSIALAPHEACAWIESQLASSGFVLSLDPNVTPATLRVARAGNSELTAVPLGAEEFELARQHPALLVQFTVTLPHTDVRTLQSTLRPLMGQNFSALMPVGNTQTIVVQGTGQQVAHVVDLLRHADEQARLALDGKDPRQPAAPRQAAGR